jgi:RNA polymerase sigma-70 factor, ECF subfamily
VQGYVRLRVADRAAAEDIVSSVFLSALAALPAFRGEGTFAAWLMAITRRAVQDHFRARRSATVDDAVLAAQRDPSPGPEAHALAAERSERLRQALATLRPSRQHLLAMRFGAGLTNAEMGDVLGMRPGAVRVAVHRAMNDLRGRFGDER